MLEASVYEQVVLKFRRQYAFSDPSAFQVSVEQASRALRGGACTISSESALKAFRDTLAGELKQASRFYPYRTPETEAVYQTEKVRRLHDIGARVFGLLPLALQEDLLQLFQVAHDQERGVRIVLQSASESEALGLLTLPWELAFAHRQLAYFARSERLLVTRDVLNVVRQAPLFLRDLRVLHVRATAPDDVYWRDLRRVGRAERAVLQKRLHLDAYLSVEHNGSLEQTLTGLGVIERATVFHFTGHGSLPHQRVYDTQDYSFLLFVRPDGTLEPVTGDQLGVQLRQKGIQLAVLNACYSAAATPASVALALVTSGIPYVVAMQGKLSTYAARWFCYGFYPALAAGQRVEVAVAAGRACIERHLPGAIDWCLPTLFTAHGVGEVPRLRRWGLELWYLAGPLSHTWLLPFHAVGAVVLLGVAGLLLLSGARTAYPDTSFLATLLGWSAVLPVGLAALAYGEYHEQTLTVADLRPGAMFARLLMSALIGMGVASFHGWSLLALVVAVGLWAQLSVMAQVLVCLPLIVWGVLLSYSQAVGHGSALVDNTRVQAAPATVSGVVVAALAMGLFLWGPLVIIQFYADTIWPAFATGLLGVLWAWIAVAFYQQRSDP